MNQVDTSYIKIKFNVILLQFDFKLIFALFNTKHINKPCHIDKHICFIINKNFLITSLLLYSSRIVEFTLDTISARWCQHHHSQFQNAVLTPERSSVSARDGRRSLPPPTPQPQAATHLPSFCSLAHCESSVQVKSCNCCLL